MVLALVTLALSLGGLTLWMMLLALVGALRFGVIVAGIALVFGIGQVWLLRTQSPVLGEARLPVVERVRMTARQSPLFAGAALVVIGIAALIVFNALYWPFNDDDAVSIYATQSTGIYQTGALPEGEGLYEAYPMLLPLSYVYSTWSRARWMNIWRDRGGGARRGHAGRHVCAGPRAVRYADRAGGGASAGADSDLHALGVERLH
jgi:hypothetical protein